MSDNSNTSTKRNSASNKLLLPAPVRPTTPIYTVIPLGIYYLFSSGRQLNVTFSRGKMVHDKPFNTKSSSDR
jgi:tmRNA-binding protein